MRVHIGIFGRRNVGKSSLLNAITRQQVSIVSEIAGTTTDPVEKPMELLPLGPVLFIDTAGLDDEGALGKLRMGKTRAVFDRTDLGVLVSDGEWGAFEDKILKELRDRKIPAIAVFNKSDMTAPDAAAIEMLHREKIPAIRTVASRGEGMPELRQALLDAAPAELFEQPAIIRDLVGPGETAILVIPIDKEAPKGRIILPQVQAIRDLLDGDASCLVVKEKGLKAAITSMKRPPKLVVTDSQAFKKVAEDTPPEIPLTSFSILFARFKGDLASQAVDTLAVEKLRPGDRILIAESCSHHPIGEDIGRVKIPKWLNERAGGKLAFDTVQGHDFPGNLADYKLAIHCGACMLTRREVLGRIMKCHSAGVPISNYGLIIAFVLGIMERALGPFPDALTAFRKAKAGSGKQA